MSLYTFATENFTTSDDRSRCPAINKWQIVRTVVFLIVAFIALLVIAQRSRATEAGFPVDAGAPLGEARSATAETLR